MTGSPQIGSQTSFSAIEQRNIWEHGLGIRVPKEIDTWNSERYWEYQSVYHIPVPQGIVEQWENENKKRWEPINIGDLNRNEADRQIKREKARSTGGFNRARERENRESRARSRKDAFFIVSLICFGLQITLAVICIAFCMLRIIDGGHIQAGIVFLLLALIPLFGAIGGILSAVIGSETLGLCTAIYNIASAVAIIVATINVHSFQLYQLFSFNVFIPLASVVAVVQTASFGVVLIIYFKLSTVAAAADYSRRIVLFPNISNAEVRRSGRRSHRKQMELKARKKAEHELQTKTDDVTRKYKEYLQKKKQIATNSDKETIHREGFSEKDMSSEQQMTEPGGSRKVNNKTEEDSSYSKHDSGSSASQKKVKQNRETAGNVNETFKTEETQT
ncbi:unnamed protein product [Onchocerca ochengi]|uniref:Uncharacterized protein n=1 Tax=Onchocerca ochengi TaxID=42157 RepID=A0A182E6S0_ONCOC|nr:unnamed protein product [Onchocerca ochengi]